jgi:hypothetical protein
MTKIREGASRLTLQLMRVLVAASLLGCIVLAAKAAESAAPAGHISEAEGFVDIDLPITQITQDSGLTRIVARGDIAGTVVGFEVDFPSKSKPSDGGSPFSWGTAQIRTLGVASNSFITLLASRYKVPAPAKTMMPSVPASVAGLQGDPGHVLDGVTKMKFFFFDSGPEDRYAEVYINVDAKNRVLEFHEKDPDYRQPLLLALTTKAP